MLRWSVLVCVMLCLAIAACGGTASQPEPGAGGALPELSQLQPPRAVHATGDSYSFVESDKQASQSSLMVGSELVLQRSKLSWALLGANFGDRTASSLTITGVVKQLYIMVSNYQTGRWQLLDTPRNAGGTFTLPQGIMRNDGSTFIALLCPDNNLCDIHVSVGLTGGTPPPAPVWNIMVWIAADNNLAPEAVADLNEMEITGSTDEVRVFAGFDIDANQIWGAPPTGIDQVRFIKVVQDNDPNSINVTGDPANLAFPRAGYNSAKPAHVREFADWVNTNFPAEHNALIIWNHGDGWIVGEKNFSSLTPQQAAEKRALLQRGHDQLVRLQHGTRSASGVMSDETDGAWDFTNNGVIAAALGGLHFDVLAFDACNMGQLEAMYDYRGVADVLVGSECLVPGAGLPYTTVLNDFNNAESAGRTPARLGKAMVAKFVEHYTGVGEYVILASFSAGQIDSLVTALHDFAAEVKTKAAAEGDFVKQAISGAFEPDAGDGSRDLKGFLTAYRGLTSDASIKTRIDAALAALGGAQIDFGQFDQNGSNGTSVWLPDDSYFTPSYQNKYSTVPFNVATGWLSMLQATGVPGGGGGGVYNVHADWAAGDYIQLEWGDTNADVDLGTTDPDGLFWTPYDGSSTPNLSLSPDSADSGEAREWAQLKSGAKQGDYYIDAFWYDYSGFNPPNPLTVNVKLYDSSMVLKQDLGSILLAEIGDYAGYAVLHFAAP